MQARHLFLFTVLGAALFTLAMANNASGPESCCFKFFTRRINVTLIRSYTMTDNRCPRMGVIFVTEKGFKICASPRETWVQRALKIVDERTF
ncbi:C-C motif chemokine 36.1 [Lampris incognitus]|uniref:C-C motif chemokine 36.1 n=1 Tax=Lampris incognitus TaxID=2546036 RepID=UPI0024B512EB|nr:C-C motif chemokine 36.1 [Lampris incognitus]